jgi:hypothetical protein
LDMSGGEAQLSDIYPQMQAFFPRKVPWVLS